MIVFAIVIFLKLSQLPMISSCQKIQQCLPFYHATFHTYQMCGNNLKILSKFPCCCKSATGISSWCWSSTWLQSTGTSSHCGKVREWGQALSRQSDIDWCEVEKLKVAVAISIEEGPEMPIWRRSAKLNKPAFFAFAKGRHGAVFEVECFWFTT